MGAANCEQFDCTMTLSAFLSGITSTGLTIGGTKTSNLYIGGLTEAATANISGTVTLNAKFQGAWNAEEGRYSEIIFQHGLEAPDGNTEIYFKALTTNSTHNTFLDGNTTITVDFNGKANAYDDDFNSTFPGNQQYPYHVGRGGCHLHGR